MLRFIYKTNVDTIASILFYFVEVTDLNPYRRDTQQDSYDKSKRLFFTHSFRPALGPTHPPIRMGTGGKAAGA
jgi:hypothetical protein